jgi:hypothetical protein
MFNWQFTNMKSYRNLQQIFKILEAVPNSFIMLKCLKERTRLPKIQGCALLMSGVETTLNAARWPWAICPYQLTL